MQFCKPVTSSYSQCANVTSNSVINRIDYPVTDNSSCVSLGEYNVVAFDVTPSSLTGVAVSYYHGTFINHITALNTIVYLECDETQEMSGIIYRHQRLAKDAADQNVYVGGQSHFKLFTRHACHYNTSTNPVVKW